MTSGARSGRHGNPRNLQRLTGHGVKRRRQRPSCGGDRGCPFQVCRVDGQAAGTGRRNASRDPVNQAPGNAGAALGAKKASRLTNAVERAGTHPATVGIRLSLRSRERV